MKEEREHLHRILAWMAGRIAWVVMKGLEKGLTERPLL